MEQQSKSITLNIPQLLTVLAPQNEKYLEWGRGTGKSTIIGWHIKELVHQMPRASFFIVGETYQQILTRTLPSTIASLERLGYKKDKHFFIGRKPPAKWKWPEPYEPPINYEHYFTWYTGSGFHLISQDRSRSNTGRGLNTDGGLGDEAALLDLEKLFTDVLATNRGNLERFKNCPLHHSLLFASTIPLTQKGKWLYRMEEEARRDPKRVFYLRASAEENRHNLGDKFFADNKKKLPKMLYEAEILNIRPEKIEGGFYALLNEAIHTYVQYNNSYLESLDYNFEKVSELDCRQDGDVNLNQPLDIALDYGAAINWLIVAQEGMSTYKYLNAMFVKTPQLTRDVVTNFCNYYRFHKSKVVNYYYDHTAIGTRGSDGGTYKDDVISTLRKAGWIVIEHYIGQAPGHDKKYRLWAAGFTNDQRLCCPLFNRHNCKLLILSMQNAPIKEGRNGFEKDKRSERRMINNREEATDASDAADTLYYGRFAARIDSSSILFDNTVM